MKSIAVFFGGISVEHDVSVITGVLTTNSIDKQRFNAIPIYIDGEGDWYTGNQLKDIDCYKKLDLKKLKKVTLVSGSPVLYQVKGKKLKAIDRISVAINCMHGGFGEDGSLSGTLNLCKIPLASPGVLPSSVSMDKVATKIILKGLGIKTLPYVCIVNGFDYSLPYEKLGYPLIVKPAHLGSSIGITTANNNRQLEDAILMAMRYDKKIIIEKCLVDFTEINCAVYKNANGNIVSSPCERPIGAKDILTFEDKYKGGSREFPADIPTSVSQKIQEISKKIYLALDFEGIIRIDFLVSEGVVYVNEINSVPGSLAYYLFASTLKEYSSMLTDLISSAEKEFATQSTLKRKFSSSILTLTGNKSAKRL